MGCSSSLVASSSDNHTGWFPKSSVRMSQAQQQQLYGSSSRPVGNQHAQRRKSQHSVERSLTYQIFKFESGDEVPVYIKEDGGKRYLDPHSDSWKTFPLIWYGHGKFFDCSTARAEEVFQYNRFQNEVDKRGEMIQTIHKLEERLDASESHRRQMVRSDLKRRQAFTGSKNKPSDAEWQGTLTMLNAKAEESLCKVCFETEMDVLLMPCRHLVVCQKCAALINSCPTCRGQIGSIERVYRN